MADKIFQNAEKQIIKNQNKKRWKRMVKLLAMVVVFCTTYALILPAITLESSCQLTEHMHQDSCYKKVVSQEDTDAERKLICGQHEHSEACWEEEKVLTCGLEETKEEIEEAEDAEVETESEENDGEEKAVKKAAIHHHDDSCYSVEKKLVCGYDSDHTHSDACYEQETIEEPLTCTNTDDDHVHTERCYGTWELICGMEEHVHDETCNIDLDEEETEDVMTLAEDAGVFTWKDDSEDLSVTLTLSNSGYTNTDYDLKVEKKDKENYQNALNTFTKHGQEIKEAAIYKISLCRKDTAQEFNSLNCSYTVQFSWASGVFTEVTEEDYLDFAYCENSNSNPTNWTESKYSADYDATGNVLSFQGFGDRYPNSGEFLFVRSYAPNGLKAGKYTLTYNTVKDAFLKDSKYSDYYNANSPIGTAGSFHLVAFDTVTLGAHTNGNVLAKNLDAGGQNFGTNNYSKELSYVQNYKIVAATSAASQDHILVVGSSNKFDYADNGNAFSINGTKMDRPNNFVQDKDTAQAPFINLARVEREITQIASNLNSYEDANITFRQENSNTVLQLEKASGVGVYHCKATEIGKFDGYVRIDGFQSGKNGTVVVNVDCTGVSEINMPKAKIVIDGQEQGTSEVIEFSAGKVIWNFVNASGVKINTTEMTGIVLAPGAKVKIGANLNGTVVADNIYVGAESHRTDFTGKVTEPEPEPGEDTDDTEYYITVHKIETGYAGTALAGAEFDLYQWKDNNWTKINEKNLVTKDNGTVALRKLQPSVAYKLVETKAPEGYKLKDGAFFFWVRTDKNQTVPNVKPEDFAGTAVEVGGTLLAANDKQEEEEDTGYILPQTGGCGTTSYTTLGLCIVLMAGAALICNNKKRKCKR